MSKTKPGRKSQSGARYPSGKLKPYRAEASPVQIRRMLDAARSTVANPILATPIGYMLLHCKITYTHVAAATEYAKVRAWYDRAIDAPPRTAASPSYGAVFGAESSLLTEEERAERAREALHTFRDIENMLAPIYVLGPETRPLRASMPSMQVRSRAVALLDRVCVENEHPAYFEEAGLIDSLERLARFFAIIEGKKG